MDHEHPLLARLGATVRALRAAKDWTRRDLAQAAGISERFLADVEAGRANPSILRLAELAAALGVELARLLESGGAARQPHIALLGLRGAGKSTVGRVLAERMGCRFVELDAMVEAMSGLQLDELFQLHGEAYYREVERTALNETLAGSPSVLAVGGGIVSDAASYSLLRAGARTVWLRARPEDHWHRVLAQGDTRPMAGNERAFADLRRILAEREPLYRRAELIVDTSGCTIDVVVERVHRAFAASA